MNCLPRVALWAERGRNRPVTEYGVNSSGYSYSESEQVSSEGNAMQLYLYSGYITDISTYISRYFAAATHICRYYISIVLAFISHYLPSTYAILWILTALALASPFIMINKAEASEGKITVEYNIDIPYTGRNIIIAHYPGAEEGFDSYDFIYHDMFNPSGISSKITSMVEGKELDANALPLNSTSSAGFSYTVIAEGGGEIPPINTHYFNVSTDGFNDENVFIS
jgi:hypothetical protein